MMGLIVLLLVLAVVAIGVELRLQHYRQSRPRRAWSRLAQAYIRKMVRASSLGHHGASTTEPDCSTESETVDDRLGHLSQQPILRAALGRACTAAFAPLHQAVLHARWGLLLDRVRAWRVADPYTPRHRLVESV